MHIVSQDTYRSQGRGVNMSDDMVRVVIDFTRQEFKRVVACFTDVYVAAPAPKTLTPVKVTIRKKTQCSRCRLCNSKKSAPLFVCTNGDPSKWLVVYRARCPGLRKP